MIKYLKYLVSLGASAPDPVVVESLSEFPEIEITAPIRVHYLELPLQSYEALGSTLHELLTESPHDQLVLLLMSHCSQGFYWGISEGLLGVLDMLGVLVIDV